MDRRTIFAVVISAVIFVTYLILQSVIFPQKKTSETARPTATPTPTEMQSKVTAVPLEKQSPAVTKPEKGISAKEITEERKVIHTDIYDITFSNRGAVATSIILNDPEADPGNNRLDDGIEMVFATEGNQPEEKTAYPFALHFGPFKTAPAMDVFVIKEEGDNKITFIRDFQINGETVTVAKTFEVVPGEYLVKLSVKIDPEPGKIIPFNFDETGKLVSPEAVTGIMYTVGIEPQIGPKFEGVKPDDRSEYRKFVVFGNSGRKEFNSQLGAQPVSESGVFDWAAVMGKYYTMIASTSNATIKNLVFDSREKELPFLRSAMYLERKREAIMERPDEYTFYIGPKKRDVLAMYPAMKFAEIAPVAFPFGTIAEILKYPLDFFSKIGNYGVAIIFLTILIKMLLYPLTRKSFESMKKMRDLSPKLQDLRAKFKDDPKRLNLEMAALYKKEGVSPLGGCLPQLLQLPIMIGLYVLFNEHFALKNAVFIPGWIDDLSIPESIAKLPFTIPVLDWSYLRLLPIIMLGTQLLSTFFTQAQSSAGDSKMKYLPYLLMGVFFFILYNLPSGLVLYWTVQNILTVFQMLLQRFLSERKGKMITAKP